MSKYAQLCKEIRQRECLSMAKFAKIINVSTDCVARWERGSTPVGPAQILLVIASRPQGLNQIRKISAGLMLGQ